MDKILEALKSKFEGVSAKQLEVKARAMAKQGKTETDVERVTLDSVIEAYADFRTNSAMDKLKAEHAAAIEKLGGKGESKSQPDKEGGKGSGGDDPKESEAIKEMRKTLKAQSELIEELKKSNAEDARTKLQSQRRSEIAEMVKVLDEPLREPYLRGDFAALDDEAYAALKEQNRTSIEAAQQYRRGAGSAFRTPGGGAPSATAGEASNEEMDKLYEAK